ncbi:MAG: hypothetical protein M1816_001979 [Peltula sp. TS41687]|nr:MAG: hypothetical protein M1816_001979 [Peltula sp. TS41687]
MTSAPAPTIPNHDEEDIYHSSSDSDFDPDAPTVIERGIVGSGQSESEGEGGAEEEEEEGSSVQKTVKGKNQSKARSRKRKIEQGAEEENRDGNSGVDDDEREDIDFDFENSGDEALIRRGGGKRRRRGKGADDEHEDGGEGGLIKTRAQRAREEKERKPLTDTSGATVDVDALWANMNKNNSALARNAQISIEQEAGLRVDDERSREKDGCGDRTNRSREQHSITDNTTTVPDTESILITRRYEYAGQKVTETKGVPKQSAEARLYLESLQQSAEIQSSSARPATTALRRPKKRSSIFEAGKPESKDSSRKLNTIEKSKLDWAGFVDKEGISDELDGHSRAKEGYLGRMDFLDRMQSKREDELRLAKGTRKV